MKPAPVRARGRNQIGRHQKAVAAIVYAAAAVGMASILLVQAAVEGRMASHAALAVLLGGAGLCLAAALTMSAVRHHVGRGAEEPHLMRPAFPPCAPAQRRFS